MHDMPCHDGVKNASCLCHGDDALHSPLSVLHPTSAAPGLSLFSTLQQTISSASLSLPSFRFVPLVPSVVFPSSISREFVI